MIKCHQKAYPGTIEQTLAEVEVCVWEVGKSLEEYLHGDMNLVVTGIELVPGVK